MNLLSNIANSWFGGNSPSDMSRHRLEIEGASSKYPSVAQNFRNIIETGQVKWIEDSDSQRHMDDPERASLTNLTIDLNSDDAFTRALNSAEDNAAQRIVNSPQLQNLLEKEVWTKVDRASWEAGVSRIVSDEINSISGLDQYRLTQKLGDEGELSVYRTADRRATHVNDLSHDIEHGTATLEYDCEAMSITEGIILQNLEDRFLPSSVNEGDFKVASNYFYVVGNHQSGPTDNNLGGHAFIMSSATGNVVEATRQSGTVYKHGADTNYSFEDFLRGEVFYAVDGTAYGAQGIGVEKYNPLRVAHTQPEGISADALYNQLPTLDTMSSAVERGIIRSDAIPPEIESLLHIKKLEVAMAGHGNSDEVLRNRFDSIVNETVLNGGMPIVLDWLETNSEQGLQGNLRAMEQVSELEVVDNSSVIFTVPGMGQ